MSRVLLIGSNPPPLQRQTKVEAIHYRTWQFLQPLLEAGHAVCLCVDETGHRPSSIDLPERVRWESVPFERIGWPKRLQAIHDAFRPEAVVTVDLYSALYATKLQTLAPIWMDLYGDPLTISQVARLRSGSDQGIGTAVALMGQALDQGDIFSVCGGPQQHMLVGELAMRGRLNSRTFGYNFVRVIYPGAPPVTLSDIQVSLNQVWGSLSIEADAFVVLWCGGYNTWTDVATLFRALERAMDQQPRLHFLSVGASTYQGVTTQYDQFVAMVKQSKHVARFHLLGWRPWAEIPDFYRASDIGINIDALHYETLYGTRTRLVEMMAYGLPVISSEGCELSYLIRDKACGLSFPTGEWEVLAQAILQVAGDGVRLKALREAARSVVLHDLSFQVTVMPLLEWLTTPQKAPDKISAQRKTRLQAARYQLRTAARLFLWRFGFSGRRA